MKKMKHFVKTLVCFAFLLGAAYSAEAQCVLACNGTPISPLQVATDEFCQTTLTADHILEDQPACPGPKTLEVRTLAGNLIVSGPEPVVINGIYMGQILSVKVTDVNTGNNCTGYIQLFDNLAPAFITCPDIEVLCNTNTHPNNLGYPNVVDNCDLNPTVTWADVVTGPDCNTNNEYIGSITRTWFAVDDYNNQSSCVQMIYLIRPTLNDVVFPPFAYLDCVNPNTTPQNAGQPTLAGNPIMNGNICQLSASFSDQIIYTCPPATHAYQIIRTWTVVNDCPPGGIISYQQIIAVEDNTPPVVICPSPIEAGTNDTDCNGSFFVPAPTATDNCSAANTLTWSISAPFGGGGQGPYYDVPAGGYIVTYYVTDQCGNTGTCVTTLDVVDDDPPTAICDEITSVSIPSSGIAVVPAFNLDDGSYDNCVPIGFTGSTDSGVTYNTNLFFDCDDVGLTITVIIRVFEINNPSSYNECEVQVMVEDKLPPVIQCPPNQTIDCIQGMPNPDLSIYGYPLVDDNCDFTLTSDSTFNLDNCGEGTITRKWTVVDESGNMAMCTQVLTVQNLTPFDGTTIIWPGEYTSPEECIEIETLHPDSLPPGFDYPVIPDQPCLLAGINYSDQVFYISYPACYKIVRTWTVMDWCSFDPLNPDQGGIWSYSQLIKVNDYTPPVLMVPPDTCVGVDANCEFGLVTLPDATATDCSPLVWITNNSPYAFQGNANASGMYPLGETVVTFKATDGCGNITFMEMVITVADKKPPTLFCSDLVTNVGIMPGGNIMVDVFADQFIAVLEDNCSDVEDIDIFIELSDGIIQTTPPTTTSLNFDCDDLGDNEVEVWVVDEAGNADVCIATVTIQDNAFLCPITQQTVSIAGNIQTADGENVEEVEVHISGQSNSMVEGSPYIFDNQPQGYDYTVFPQFNEGIDNGVSTWDLVLISRHILNVELLDSPFKIIAADANGSGSVSTLDQVAIRKVILNIEPGFPNNVNSWRFVDADYVFQNPADPFTGGFPEAINLNNLNANQMEADFIGIKVGDVNESAAANSQSGAEERQFAGVLNLLIPEQEVRAGERVEVSIQAEDMDEIAGLQFTLGFDPASVSVNGIENCALPGFSEEGNTGLKPGALTVSWDHPTGWTLDKEECLFVVDLEAKTDGKLSEWLSLASGPTRAEAYRLPNDLLELNLRVNGASTESFRLFQNRPNPFSQETVIGFYLPEATEAKLTVYDVSGKIVHIQSGDYASGYQEIRLPASLFPQGGIYWYRLDTPSWSDLQKMMCLR